MRKRTNRVLYKTELTEKPLKNTMLERLKQDYINERKKANVRLIYRVNPKQIHRMRSRKSIREYLHLKETKEKERMERELMEFQKELDAL